jgi:predicted phosphodiesterase
MSATNLKNSRNPEGSRIVDRYVGKFPQTASQTLAKLIFKKHPLLFSNVNAITNAIRYRRGAMGPLHRKKRAFAAPVVIPSKFNPLNPLDLPASDEKDWVPFVMDGVTKVLVIGDLHLPYHNLASLTLALQTGEREKCDGVLINGDLIDFHTLSRFEKDPEKRSFKEERAIAKAFLRRLRELFLKARIVFKEGNHDERLRKFVMDRAPEIYEESIFGLDALLGLGNLGIEHVNEKREVMLGKLPVLHGHELPHGIAAPVNPARGAYLRAKTSVLVNHHHKTSEHTETDLKREIITTWSVGCLCQLRQQYNPFNGNNHGFAIVEIAKGGDYMVRNSRIHNGKLLN